MPTLREQLEPRFQGRVCLLGLGNVDRGDDGFGVRLAEALIPPGIDSGPGRRWPHRRERPTDELPDAESPAARSGGWPDSTGSGAGPVAALGDTEASRGRSVFRGAVVIAGTTPERFIGRVAEGGFDDVIFLDAVDFGGSPGTAVLLDADGMAARFPQISTHRLSLGLLARWIESGGRTKAWLLGVQPESLEPGGVLTATIRTTLELLGRLLNEVAAEAGADEAAENREVMGEFSGPGRSEVDA